MKHYNTFRSGIFRILLFPVLPLEIIFTFMHYVLLKLHVLSPGGIVLKLTKNTPGDIEKND